MKPYEFMRFYHPKLAFVDACVQRYPLCSKARL